MIISNDYTVETNSKIDRHDDSAYSQVYSCIILYRLTEILIDTMTLHLHKLLYSIRLYRLRVILTNRTSVHMQGYIPALHCRDFKSDIDNHSDCMCTTYSRTGP